MRPDDEGTQGQQKLAIVERSSAEILLAMTDLIVGGGPLPQLFGELTPLLRQLTDCTLVEFAVCDAARNCIVTHFWKLEPETRFWDSSSSAAEESPGAWVWEHQEPVRIPDVEGETRFAKTVAELREHGVRSFHGGADEQLAAALWGAWNRAQRGGGGELGGGAVTSTGGAVGRAGGRES